MYRSGVIDLSGIDETLNITKLTDTIDIEGFQGGAGRLMLVMNSSTEPVTIKHLVGPPSTAINVPGGADTQINPNEGFLVFKVSQGWQVLRAGYAGLGTLAYQNANNITTNLIINTSGSSLDFVMSGGTVPRFRMVGSPSNFTFGSMNAAGTVWDTKWEITPTVVNVTVDGTQIQQLTSGGTQHYRPAYIQHTTARQFQANGWSTLGGSNTSNGEILIGASPYGMRLSADPAVDSSVRITNMLDGIGSAIKLIVRGGGTPFTAANFTPSAVELNANTTVTGNFAVTGVVNFYGAQLNKYNAGDLEFVHRSTGNIWFYTDSATKVPFKIEQLAPTDSLRVRSSGTYIKTLVVTSNIYLDVDYGAFYFRSTASVERGRLEVVDDGVTLNTGEFVFSTLSLSSYTERMRIKKDGDVLLSTGALQVKGSMATIVAASTTLDYDPVGGIGRMFVHGNGPSAYPYFYLYLRSSNASLGFTALQVMDVGTIITRSGAGITLTVGNSGQRGYFYAGGSVFWMAAEASVLNAFGVANGLTYMWTAGTQAFVCDANVMTFARLLDSNQAIKARSKTIGVYTVAPRASSPAYFVINTYIPWIEGRAPLVRIRGYNYGASNHVCDFTLMWYIYPAPNVLYSQISPVWGTHVPPRVRIDRWTPDAGANYYARIEIDNVSNYWTHWFAEVEDYFGVIADYRNWSDSDGAFTSPSAYVTTCSQYANATIDTNGAIKTYGGYLSSNNAIGYTTGTGGSATQATSKATGVTVNKPHADITLAAGAIAAFNNTTFTYTNSFISANDTLVISHVSNGTLGAYRFAYACGAGFANITIYNGHNVSLNEQPIIRITVIKGSAT